MIFREVVTIGTERFYVQLFRMSFNLVWHMFLKLISDQDTEVSMETEYVRHILIHVQKRI